MSKKKQGDISFIQNEKGAAYVDLIIIVMIIALIASVLMEYLRIDNHIRQIRTGAEQAITALATDNWDETYKSTREGYSGAYHKEEDTWKETFSDIKAMEELSNVLGLNGSGEKGNYYTIKDFEIEQVNAAFKNKTEVLSVKARIKVEIPFHTIIEGIAPLNLTLQVQSNYQRKF